MSIFDRDGQMVSGAVMNPYFAALQGQPRRVPMNEEGGEETPVDIGPPPPDYTEDSWRKLITDTAPPGMLFSEWAEETRKALAGQRGTEEKKSSKYDLPPGYVPPRRSLVVSSESGQVAPAGFESGNLRVNEFNEYERDELGNPLGSYNVDEDWKMIYGMTPKQRQDMFMKLYNRGIYHGRKPSTFFLDPDAEGEVIKRLLHVANVEGRTLSWVVKSIVENVPERPGKKGGISGAQADSLIQAAAQQVLGRNLSKNEMTPAITALRGNLGSMPPSEAAKAALRGQATDEQMAYGVSKYASLMARALR